MLIGSFFTGAFLFVFILFVWLSMKPMLQHHLSAPACEKPAKGKINVTFITHHALQMSRIYPFRQKNTPDYSLVTGTPKGK